ncbi:MAG: hypothetical protein JXQ96_15345 [Cyclobacteriaceae bacterium]
MNCKNIIITLIIVLLGFTSSAHDIQIAKFEVSYAGNNNSVLIKFDRDDIINSIASEGNKVVSISDQIFNYVYCNFSLKFNHENVNLLLTKIVYETDMIYVFGKLNCKMIEVNTVEIINTCLQELEDHNNIVEFDMKDRSRSFRMTKDRTYTRFKY